MKAAAPPALLAALTDRAQREGVVLELVDAGGGEDGPPRDRAYHLHLQPALWGGIDVVRRWGRRGHLRRPRQLVTHHVDLAEAVPLIVRVIRRRLRHGYRPASAVAASPEERR